MESDSYPLPGWDDATQLWSLLRSEIHSWIIATLRKMGLPTTAAHTVRTALLQDDSLHEDIRAEILEAFWLAVNGSKIRATDGLSWTECARRWLYRVTRRITQRLATVQAKEFLALVDESADHGACHGVSSRAEEELISLNQALRALPLEESRLLVLVDGWEVPYSELVAAFGTSVKALRTRVCRIRGRVRQALSDGDCATGEQVSRKRRAA